MLQMVKFAMNHTFKNAQRAWLKGRAYQIKKMPLQ